MWQEHRQTCVLDARQQRAYHTKEGIEGRPHLSNHLSPSSRTTNVTGEFLGRCFSRAEEEIRWDAQVYAQLLNLWE